MNIHNKKFNNANLITEALETRKNLHNSFYNDNSNLNKLVDTLNTIAPSYLDEEKRCVHISSYIDKSQLEEVYKNFLLNETLTRHIVLKTNACLLYDLVYLTDSVEFYV